MPEVSTFRLYLLRATYLLIVVGLGFTIWPGILHPPKDLALMPGVVRSLLGAVSLLAILGIRYPLKVRLQGKASSPVPETQVRLACA